MSLISFVFSVVAFSVGNISFVVRFGGTRGRAGCGARSCGPAARAPIDSTADGRLFDCRLHGLQYLPGCILVKIDPRHIKPSRRLLAFALLVSCCVTQAVQGDREQTHWAFIPPVRPNLPTVEQAAWPKTAVDCFVLARLEQQNLKPSREADRATLIRRVSLDLTGLPPTRAEVDDFVADASSDAYERLVDCLLSSPRFGERMAQDWLDAARFADSNGYQVDRDREMWPWREWVIQAFNRNLSFDQFTIEQLAGDLLPNPSLEQRIATGFHRNHMINEEGGIIPEEFLAEYCADRVETTATVWLGLTMNCARCHDHKYDPLTQKDYYGLFAFFHNVPESGVGTYTANIRRNTPPFLKLPTPEVEAKIAALNKELEEPNRTLMALRIPPDVITALQKAADKRSETEKKLLDDFHVDQVPGLVALAQRVGDLKKQIDEADLSIPISLVMSEMEAPRPTHVLLRGAYDKLGERVTAATPARLALFPANAPTNRLGLAQWLIAANNPLTTRVTVNRLWQSVFGVGLVRTGEDFGVKGEPPSHPALLDWLAVEFASTGWDVKRMMKLLVMSAAYRQDARTTAALRAIDPDNRWLARGPRYRLSAETIRDQALAISGLLVEKVGGPSVKPYHPPGLYEQVVSGSSAGTYQQDKGESLYRRSLYTYWKRSVPNPAMLIFDAPFRETCAVRRARTSTPLQALNLLNDPTYVEAARFLAQRMMCEGGSTLSDRIHYGFRLVLSRQPRTAEVDVLSSGWRRMEAGFRADPTAATNLLAVGETKADSSLDCIELAAYCTVASTLLNLDEAITKN
jgi:hypothetical protein